MVCFSLGQTLETGTPRSMGQPVGQNGTHTLFFLVLPMAVLWDILPLVVDCILSECMWDSGTMFTTDPGCSGCVSLGGLAVLDWGHCGTIELLCVSTEGHWDIMLGQLEQIVGTFGTFWRTLELVGLGQNCQWDISIVYNGPPAH